MNSYRDLLSFVGAPPFLVNKFSLDFDQSLIGVFTPIFGKLIKIVSKWTSWLRAVMTYNTYHYFIYQIIYITDYGYIDWYTRLSYSVKQHNTIITCIM